MLPAFLLCYKKLILVMTDESETSKVEVQPCTHCCNWTFNSDKSEVQIDDLVGKDYPPSSSDAIFTQNETKPEGQKAGRKQVGSVKLTTEWMLKVMTHGYSQMQRGNWNKANPLEYLKSCNRKGSRVEIIAQKSEEDRKNEIFNPSAIEPHI